MKRIYVAGPYSIGNTPRNVQLNVNKAISIGCHLIRKGWSPFIPHLTHYIWLHPDGDFDYDKWLELDFSWLEVCEALFRIRGDSPGANEEEALAKELGIPIFYDLDEVPNLA